LSLGEPREPRSKPALEVLLRCGDSSHLLRQEESTGGRVDKANLGARGDLGRQRIEAGLISSP